LLQLRERDCVKRNTEEASKKISKHLIEKRQEFDKNATLLLKQDKIVLIEQVKKKLKLEQELVDKFTKMLDFVEANLILQEKLNDEYKNDEKSVNDIVKNFCDMLKGDQPVTKTKEADFYKLRNIMYTVMCKVYNDTELEDALKEKEDQEKKTHYKMKETTSATDGKSFISLNDIFTIPADEHDKPAKLNCALNSDYIYFSSLVLKE